MLTDNFSLDSDIDFVVAHTHNSPANSTYSAFSYADLEAISKLLRNRKIDNTKFVSFLSTTDGTNYAFTIDDTAKFLKFFALLKDDNFGEIIANKRNEYIF